MKMRKVNELSGCKYVEVNDSGLVIEQGGARKVIEVLRDYLWSGANVLITREICVCAVRHHCSLCWARAVSRPALKAHCNAESAAIVHDRRRLRGRRARC